MNCLVCERPVNVADSLYHEACAHHLFGTNFIPSVPFSYADIPIEVQKMIGQMSISGVQPKLSVIVDKDTKTIQVAPSGGTHILKPTPEAFPFLAENENLSMNLAGEMTVETPPHGLVKMSDGRLSYLIRRFDRGPDGKTPVEDFAQLLEKDDKYNGSFEQIGKFVKKHSCIPFVDTQKLFVRALYFYLIGNGDAHLKNFAMIGLPTGHRLADAYDIVNSRLVLPAEADDLAITVNGRRNRLMKKDFVALAKYLEITDKQLDRFFEMAHKLEERIHEYVQNSFLPPARKDGYLAIFHDRFGQIFVEPHSRK